MKNYRTLQKPDEIERFLLGFDFFEKYVHGRAEGEEYVKTHARRFAETLRMMPSLGVGSRVLELGAVPYYFTILMKKTLGLSIDVASFYEVETLSCTSHVVTNRQFQEQYEFQYQAINVERDVFPFDNATFDLVLCCEMLEHLLINPSHMLYEVHRVLRTDGYLLLSTPNVLRWSNVSAMLRGQNIYDRYLGNGIYGRHNREYSPAEIKILLEANGFQIEQMNVRNVYGSEILNRFPLFRERRDNIFTLARATGRARIAYPDTLYALTDEYRNVVRSSIIMGENEAGHLGRGWHDFEDGDPGFRWIMKEAQFSLKRTANDQRIGLRLRSDNPKITRGVLTVALDVNDDEFEAKTLTDHSWHDLTFRLPDKEWGCILDCRIKVSETWIPKLETGANDSRELGIAVSKIWLE
jgi:SAM-dependent methyltransferase